MGKQKSVPKRLIADVSITNQIYCFCCKLSKARAEFSNSQLAKSRYSSLGYKAKRKRPSCKECTAKVNLNMHCIVCGKEKSLEEFYKNQRRYREMARCKDCWKLSEESTPLDESDDSDPSYSDALESLPNSTSTPSLDIP
ncbi:hypothetical protein K7432_015289 [Basidiobolus ranarum]|uniref:Stc1 domain-containing protein n=1 Tax=Basidiobolus ranarum TaxID=34480 RepID=A0ABR2WGJ2_9FUNG